MDLPQFPLTGIFFEQVPADYPRGFDQALRACGVCGHAQLANVLPPPILYGEEYAHRSSSSHLSGDATDVIISYIDQLAPGYIFDSVLEIGCNNMVLLNKLAPRGRTVCGIDPIWIDHAPETPENVNVIGGYVEDVDFATQLETKLDLVVSTHNLEHITDPLDLINRLLDVLADDGLIVMEVPDSACLIHHGRFDQVFHQHVHYFTMASFLRLVARAGGKYRGHMWNYRNWGGSFTVAFGKVPASAVAPDAHIITPEEIRTAVGGYRQHMARFLDMINAVPHRLVGYGAGQMVPAVAYHLQSDLSFLDCIYDDAPNRDGLVYPYLSPTIRMPDADMSLDDTAVVITSLDATRPIMNRIRNANPLVVYPLTNAC